MQPKRNAEQKKPLSDLEIGLPKGECFRGSKIIWEQSDHVNLTEKARLNATSPKAAGNTVSICIECDRRMALMFRKRTARLRYQGQEITAYSVREFEPEDRNVHLQELAAIELRFLVEQAA